MGDSGSDSENEIRFGTPLEPYEEDELPSKRKYQQQPDQYAVDDHGRRRFHGAFTGGFSAGFGNSVGTPEGWTPTTFKSSRSEKAAFANQRAEDFMDDEDRGEFGIAPRHMQTHHEFSGQKRPRQQQFHDGPIPGEAVLSQLLRPVHETAAVRMLRAMGWRPGRGTGEKVSPGERKKARQQHRVYGCYMPPEMRQPEDAEDSSDSEFEYETLFEPDDYEPYILNRKSDRFGLGYSGLSRHSVLGNLVGEYGMEAGSSKSHLFMKDKGRKVSIRGQAFGVGAFEADDEDIYATEDMTHYDFALGGTGEDTQKKKPAKKTGQVIEGFVKSSKPLPSVPSYPPPALPRDYVPAAAGVRRSRFEPTTHPERDQGLGRHELSAEARGLLLGETPVPKVQDAPKPVQPVPSHEPVTLAERTINFTSTEQAEMDYIPVQDSGKELVKVFKPFVSNPQKQARYEQYLKDKESVILETRETDKLSEWERNREMAEFEQAAKLYKPLTGIMGDRFTHASEPDEALNPLCAVAKSAVNYGLASKDQIEAATKGLYGLMTRREASWRPEALLCKRFNVPDPGGTRPQESTSEKPKVSYSIFSYLESSVHDKDSFAKEQTKFSGSKSMNRDTKITNEEGTQNIPDQKNNNQNPISANQKQETQPTGFNKRLTVAELFLKESEKVLNTKEAEVTETINNFDKMDLYKAIFQSDSEEEVTESDRNETSDFIDRPKNTERNTSPPRGIFANIDFDELNSWRRNDREEKPKPECKPIEKPIDITEDVYGPKLPENLQIRLQNETIDVNSSSSEDSWVDAKEVKHKKHKKKKSKKSKSKHKKSKHKKKDR